MRPGIQLFGVVMFPPVASASGDRLKPAFIGTGDDTIAPTPARYVKLVVTKPGADGKIRVASFQVFEDASSTGRKPGNLN